MNFLVSEKKYSYPLLMRKEKKRGKKFGLETVFHEQIQFAKMELKFQSYFSS